MDDFLWSKNTVEPAWKRSSWQVFFTSAAILLLPSFSLRRLWQCSTVVVVRHDFIFPSLTFWSSLSCKVELKLQFLYYYQWNIQMIYCTLLLIKATKSKVQASSNFLDVLAKIIFAIVLFGKLLMDPDKIPKDNSVFWQRFITSLLRLCLVRLFVVKCLFFF